MNRRGCTVCAHARFRPRPPPPPLEFGPDLTCPQPLVLPLGTFKYAKSGRQHLATGDSRKTIRELGKPGFVTDTDRKTLFKLIKSP